MLYYKQKICDKEGKQMTIDLALEKMIPGMQEIYGDLVDCNISNEIVCIIFYPFSFDFGSISPFLVGKWRRISPSRI